MTVVVLLTAYFLGSIPFSLLIARIWKGVDLCRTGSGNPGGMNTLREVGWPAGLTAIGLDLAKGAAAVLLARNCLSASWATPAAGAAVVAGHCYSLSLTLSYLWEKKQRQERGLPWWKLQPRLGGKGLATAIGVLLVISWPTLLGTLLVFALVALLLIRRGLRGSPVVAQATTAAILLSPFMLWYWHSSGPMLFGGVAIAVIATIKHIPYLALSPRWPNARPEPEGKAAARNHEIPLTQEV